MFRQRHLWLFAAFLILPIAIASASASDTIIDPLVTRFSLTNGLSVLLAPDARSSVVGLQLRYRVGARDDPEARPGLAVLVQRLMARRTMHVGEGQYDRLLDEAGGYDAHWWTGSDATAFEVSVPSDRMALPLWLWSDQMGYFAASLDDLLVQQQVVVVHNEHVQKIDNAPAGRAVEFMKSALYPTDHPYRMGGRPIENGLEGLTATEVRAFVEPRYAPGNAILVMTGDFEPQVARQLIETYFAGLPRKGVAARRPGERPILTKETRLRVAAQVELPLVSISWSTPALGAPGDAELDLIGELLAGDRAGLLRWKLVDELKIATGVSARQVSQELGSRFVIEAAVTRGHTPGEVVEAIDQVLVTIQEKGPTPDLLRGSTVGYLIRHLFSLEQSSKRAARHAACEAAMIAQPCLTSWIGRYSGISSGALATVAARELPLRRRIVVEVTPTPGAPIAGELRSRSDRGE